MGKIPSFGFYPGDWIQDTRPLSLAAKGAWIDILCAMWRSQIRGRLSLPWVGYSRLIGATVDQTKAVITELVDLGVCDCEINGKKPVSLSQKPTGNGQIMDRVTEDVTLINRRMVRDEIERENTRLRVSRHREKTGGDTGNGECNAPCNGACNGDVTVPLSLSSSSSGNTKVLPSTPLTPQGAGAVAFEPDFLAFWELAPRGSSRKLTFERWVRAWKTLKSKHENPSQVLLTAFRAYLKDCALDSSFGKDGRRPQNAETFLGPQKATWKQWIGKTPEDVKPDRKLPFKENPYAEFGSR